MQKLLLLSLVGALLVTLLITGVLVIIHRKDYEDIKARIRYGVFVFATEYLWMVLFLFMMLMMWHS